MSGHQRPIAERHGRPQRVEPPVRGEGGKGSGIGASRPLRRLPAMVSFLSRKPALSPDSRSVPRYRGGNDCLSAISARWSWLTMQVLRRPTRKVPGPRLRPGRRLAGISDRMDQDGLIAPFRERAVCQFASVVESGTMLRFAARGFAAEPVTAAWLPSWYSPSHSAGSIAEPAAL
jgi:hypothetical protein